MKNLGMILVLVAMLVVGSGCQATKGLCEDVAGMAQWSAEKLEAASQEAADRDADRMARRLAHNQAILKARMEMSKTAPAPVASKSRMTDSGVR